jgi:hypothetical protein
MRADNKRPERMKGPLAVWYLNRLSGHFTAQPSRNPPRLLQKLVA